MRVASGALLMALLTSPAIVPSAELRPDAELQRIVAKAIEPMLPANGAGGVAVALRIDGRTLFFNYGWADFTRKQPITSDSLFNLASVSKVFDTAVLARAIQQGTLALDDPTAKYVSELDAHADIGRVTIGQLATQTSGLLFRQDYPPWPDDHYTLPEYFRTLNEWKADEHHQPGKQHLYTHAGFVLLRLALERSLGQPIGTLIEQRVAAPLGMNSTVAPKPCAPGGNPLGELDAGAKSHTVQGYDEHGEPVGEPGNIQGYYLWPGTGQIFSSARDMAVFLAANLDGVPHDRALNDALALTHKSVFGISRNNDQALAWEINRNFTPIVEKNGGMNHTSTYIGFMPGKKIGIVILSNRGNQDPHHAGRGILLAMTGELVTAGK